MLSEAIVLATRMHQGQLRSSGEPYISHPLAVANILKQYGFSEEVQAAGVLHDICEDTSFSNFEMSRQFSPEIALVVYALSKNKKPKKKEFSEHDFRFALYIRRFAACAAQNPMVLYVKIADQIHNLSTMQCFSVEKQNRKREEVVKYFFPLYRSFTNIPPEDLAGYTQMLDHLKNIVSLSQNTAITA